MNADLLYFFVLLIPFWGCSTSPKSSVAPTALLPLISTAKFSLLQNDHKVIAELVCHRRLRWFQRATKMKAACFKELDSLAREMGANFLLLPDEPRRFDPYSNWVALPQESCRGCVSLRLLAVKNISASALTQKSAK